MTLNDLSVILLTARHVTNHCKSDKHDYQHTGFLLPFLHLLTPSILDSIMFSIIYGPNLRKFQYSNT